MDGKGFFACLFDLSFKEFITTRIIKVLYILHIVIACIMGLGMIISGMTSGNGFVGVVSFILGPCAALLYLLMARIGLELTMVFFRISENTDRLVALQSPQDNVEPESETGEYAKAPIPGRIGYRRTAAPPAGNGGGPRPSSFGRVWRTGRDRDIPVPRQRAQWDDRSRAEPARPIACDT